MRISSGEFSGTSIFSPKGMNARPTMAKARQAIFNMLRPVLPGSTIIDFFAGTGALGFEALSNGVANVVFVENKYTGIIHRNAAKLKIESGAYAVIKSDYRKAFGFFEKNGARADFIFADPPYNKGIVKNFLKMFGKSDILCKHGMAVVESHIKEADEISDLPGLETEKKRKYGDTLIIMLKRRPDL